MTRLFERAAAFLIALLAAGTMRCAAAPAEHEGALVELETPLASPQALQGYLRQTGRPGASPAVILLHGCNGDFRRLDARWGRRIAAWGYVTLAVDSFGPRGLKDTCDNGAPADLAFDAYRALNFLVQQSFVDPDRVAALGFAQGGWLALTSVERGAVERGAANKFRAAIAFYPPCLAFKDDMTVPTLIMVGERDDWTPAEECRRLVEGRDDYGISRRRGDGAPVTLIVYPGAYHAFDNPALRKPVDYLGHHLAYDRAAADQSAGALRNFLDMTIGGKERTR